MIFSLKLKIIEFLALLVATSNGEQFCAKDLQRSGIPQKDMESKVEFDSS